MYSQLYFLSSLFSPRRLARPGLPRGDYRPFDLSFFPHIVFSFFSLFAAPPRTTRAAMRQLSTFHLPFHFFFSLLSFRRAASHDRGCHEVIIALLISLFLYLLSSLFRRADSHDLFVSHFLIAGDPPGPVWLLRVRRRPHKKLTFLCFFVVFPFFHCRSSPRTSPATASAQAAA